ncbi:ATP-binding response regulator [Planktothrix agardhii]|uniref:ATP-binding response regulator n=1 Tax=Planktothrix agardhii TaxID=1160 RepID=UPI0020A80F50|nr:hybrid sensor histidine kinase/response regulator [Planktothrix agardhii]CAD5911094.1 Alkaline phosphatase synthesis sensor protein PhoR [Planktothrix agardhii]
MKNRPSQIFAADPETDTLLILETILTEEGYCVSTSSNGKEAIASINTHPPDLILWDVMMPDADGYEVTYKIRSTPQLPFIPIVLLASDPSIPSTNGLELGADDFLWKPIQVNELLARVRNLLRLKHSLDSMREMALAREDFVSRLTHDLRNPLIAAQQMLTLLGQGKFGTLPPTVKEALHTIALSNDNLITLVNTLLEVHRFEAGCKPMAITTFDLYKLIKEVVKEQEALAVSKNLSLIFEIQQGPFRIQGDRLELRRVLTNLVSNAIKFTERGQVKITVEYNAQSVSIQVEDTGPGITESEQNAIFERFRTGNQKGAGSGLGLHLSQRIAEAHSGRLEVTSELGVGSIFTLCLPQNKNC